MSNRKDVEDVHGQLVKQRNDRWAWPKQERLQKLQLSMTSRKESHDQAIKQAQDPITQLKLQAFRKLSEADKNKYQSADPEGYNTLLRMQLYSLDRRFLENLKHYAKMCGLESLKTLKGNSGKEAMVSCLYRKYPTLNQIETKGGIQVKQFFTMFFKCICLGYKEPFLWKEPKDIGNLESKPKSKILSLSNSYHVGPGGSNTYPPFPPPIGLQSKENNLWGLPPGAVRFRYDTLPRLSIGQVQNIVDALYPGYRGRPATPMTARSRGTPAVHETYSNRVIYNGRLNQGATETFMEAWVIAESTIERQGMRITGEGPMGFTWGPPPNAGQGAIDSTCSLNHAYGLIRTYASSIRIYHQSRLYTLASEQRQKLAATQLQSKARGQTPPKYLGITPEMKESIRITSNWKISSAQVKKVIKVFTVNQLFAIMANPYIPYTETGARAYILNRHMLQVASRNSMLLPSPPINWAQIF